MPRRFAAAAVLLAALVAAPPAAAQSTLEGRAAFAAAASTPVGALGPVVTPTVLGATRGGVGLRVLYGHNAFRKESGIVSSAYGLGVNATLLGGRLDLHALGAYAGQRCDPDPDVPLTVPLACVDQPMGAAGATVRLVRGRIGGEEGDDGGLATVSLDVQGGYARSRKGGIGAALGLDPLVLRDTLDRVPTHDEFVTGAVGLPVAFTGRADAFTVSGFVIPTAVLGGVRTRAYGVYADSLGNQYPGTGRYRTSGGRFVLAFGLAAVEPRSGLGLQLSAQRIAGDGAAWGGGVGLTWQTWQW